MGQIEPKSSHGLDQSLYVDTYFFSHTLLLLRVHHGNTRIQHMRGSVRPVCACYRHQCIETTLSSAVLCSTQQAIGRRGSICAESYMVYIASHRSQCCQ